MGGAGEGLPSAKQGTAKAGGPTPLIQRLEPAHTDLPDGAPPTPSTSGPHSSLPSCPGAVTPNLGPQPRPPHLQETQAVSGRF